MLPARGGGSQSRIGLLALHPPVAAAFLVPHPPYYFDTDGSKPTEEVRVERNYGILNAVQLYDFVEVQRTDDGAPLMPTAGDGG
jgi:hypothetical protein